MRIMCMPPSNTCIHACADAAVIVVVVVVYINERRRRSADSNQFEHTSGVVVSSGSSSARPYKHTHSNTQTLHSFTPTVTHTVVLLYTRDVVAVYSKFSIHVHNIDWQLKLAAAAQKSTKV